MYRTGRVLKPVRLEGPGRADRPGGPEAGHPLVRATFGGNHYRRVHTQVKFT